MLNIFRRHRRTCKGWKRGRRWWKCNCPISAEGSLEGQFIRRTLGTNNWDRAQEIIAGWTRSGPEGITDPHQRTMTVKRACVEYMAELRARGLAASTTRKYDSLCNLIESYAQANNLTDLARWDLEATARLRRSWRDGNLSALKKLERLRQWFAFCVDRAWIRENYAKRLENPQVRMTPTMPFSHDEITAMLTACDGAEHVDGMRLRALVMLLRYSGLRIQDAMTLAREHVTDGKLFLYTAKTGTPVHLPLPPDLCRLLDVTAAGQRYFFWSGDSVPTAAARLGCKWLHYVFRDAKIRNGHTHRFRDTFAVELLLAGVPIEQVSVLLGHSSVRITEKHYAPWVRARQEQLEANVRRTWETSEAEQTTGRAN